MERRLDFRLVPMAISLALCMGFTAAQAGELSIEFKEKGAKEGTIYFAVFDTAGDWLKKPLRSEKVAIANESATALIADLPPGEYAISAFHDLNGNGKLDSNFIGIPNEPFGFSNDASGSFGPPKFDQAKFKIAAANEKIVINVKK